MTFSVQDKAKVNDKRYVKDPTLGDKTKEASRCKAKAKTLDFKAQDPCIPG